MGIGASSTAPINLEICVETQLDHNNCLIRQAEAASAAALDRSSGILDFGNDSGKWDAMGNLTVTSNPNLGGHVEDGVWGEMHDSDKHRGDRE